MSGNIVKASLPLPLFIKGFVLLNILILPLTLLLTLLMTGEERGFSQGRMDTAALFPWPDRG